MPDIALYDTLTRGKKRLEPVAPGRISMYVCGPTVYDRAHLGNARAVVVFDVLFRLLRHEYGQENVRYVRNVTDVDDKINARARESGRPISEITAETTGWFHEDMDALGAMRPTHEPRATEFIGPMTVMIETLIARGHAYEAEGHVLFSVGSYPEYGTLSRRSVEDMRAGARVEVAPYKRDPMDFVLWKPSDDATPGWESPWGRGRPGWHIECSAMAKQLLGLAFDIHGGGNDLTFPHHENELAQSRCAHPEGAFASIWMHNGMLNVDGAKMSKSLGNFFTVRELLDGGVSAEVIRFVLLSTHYRQPLDWTDAKVKEVTALLTNWDFLLRSADKAGLSRDDAPPQPAQEVLDALADEMNTPLAITHLHRLAGQVRLGDEDATHGFIGALHLLGLKPERVRGEAIEKAVGRAFVQAGGANEASLRRRVSELIEARTRAREARDFAKADAIRGRLSAAGVIVMDRVGAETEWELGPDFSPSELDGDDT